jgi:plasmid replication initiation protein
MDPGGDNCARLEQALDRLKGTTLKFIRKDQARSRSKAIGLIGGYEIISCTAKDRIGTVEIDIPEWFYDAVTTHLKPEVLTVHRDYFLIEKGLGRFIYRLARWAGEMMKSSLPISPVSVSVRSTTYHILPILTFSFVVHFTGVTVMGLSLGL